jgi:hypothetical protein
MGRAFELGGEPGGVTLQRLELHSRLLQLPPSARHALAARGAGRSLLGLAHRGLHLLEGGAAPRQRLSRHVHLADEPFTFLPELAQPRLSRAQALRDRGALDTQLLDGAPGGGRLLLDLTRSRPRCLDLGLHPRPSALGLGQPGYCLLDRTLELQRALLAPRQRVLCGRQRAAEPRLRQPLHLLANPVMAICALGLRPKSLELRPDLRGSRRHADSGLLGLRQVRLDFCEPRLVPAHVSGVGNEPTPLRRALQHELLDRTLPDDAVRIRAEAGLPRGVENIAQAGAAPV